MPCCPVPSSPLPMILTIIFICVGIGIGVDKCQIATGMKDDPVVVQKRIENEKKVQAERAWEAKSQKIREYLDSDSMTLNLSGRCGFMVRMYGNIELVSLNPDKSLSIRINVDKRYIDDQPRLNPREVTPSVSINRITVWSGESIWLKDYDSVVVTLPLVGQIDFDHGIHIDDSHEQIGGGFEPLRNYIM